MNIQKIDYEGDRAVWLKHRKQDVTASVVGALFNVHPYVGPLGLYGLKVGIVPEVDENAAMARGRLFEGVVFQMIAEQHPDWQIERNTRFYYRDADARLGGTPDGWADIPGRKGKTIIQVKTVADMAFKSKWIDQGEVMPPMWINLQAILEAYMVGAQHAMIAAMVIDFAGNPNLHLVDVPMDHAAGIIVRMKALAADFWRRVEDGDPPVADFIADADLIKKMYSTSNGLHADMADDNRLPELLEERQALGDQLKLMEEEKGKLDTELREKIGHYESVSTNGWFVTNKQQTRKAHEVKESTFRVLRVKRAND